MKLLSRLFRFEQRNFKYPPDWLLDLRSTNSTNFVSNPENALQYTVVFACVRILAEAVASLPLILYRRESDESRRRATDHPLYSLLHHAPNPLQTSVEFWEMVMGHLLLWGNAYCRIESDSRGNIKYLWLLRPDSVRVEPLGTQVRYWWRQGDSEIELPSFMLMHLKAFSVNAYQGLSPIAQARRALQLTAAAEQFGTKFFENDARPGIALIHPSRLSDEAYRHLRDSWERRHMGPNNAARMAILEEGMSIAEIGIPPEDAQFLDTRKFQMAEIARIFRVPPHMLGDLDRSTHSNIEHQSIEFVTQSLRPWLVRIEQAIRRDLLLPSERSQLFAEFLVDGLLRGDTESRYRAYAIGRQNGWLSANDIRRLENMDAIQGGDVYLVPLNMVPAGGQGTPVEPARQRFFAPETREEEINNRRRNLMATFLPLLTDLFGRITRREIADIQRAIKKYLPDDVPGMLQWLQQFKDDNIAFIERAVEPIAYSYMRNIIEIIGQELQEPVPDQSAFLRDYVHVLGVRHTGETVGRVHNRITDPTQPSTEAVQSLLDQWRDGRAAAAAHYEATRMNNAFSLAAYISTGVLRLRWVALGDSCPYCRALNGRVVGIQGTFVSEGQELDGGEQPPLRVSSNIGHPPLHQGCDCIIRAA